MGEREWSWRDGERVVVFREGLLGEADRVLAEHGWESYELLTTPRAVAEASVELAEHAATVHYVSPGPVPDAAAELIGSVSAAGLVALGGGRVIDAAKAIAAVRGGRVAALPTTLSGAEMTAIHRLPTGHHAPRLLRPALVIADPGRMTSLPERNLRASAMNALAHAADSLYTPFSNPVATMAALRGAELLAGSLEQAPSRRDRGALALGSVLAAYALDAARFALHHVVCQTLVRVLRIAHAETNATMLPHTMEAMRARAPEAIAALAEALGTKPGYLRRRIEKLGGGPRRLSELDPDESRLDEALDAMLARPELGMTPDPPGRDELLALVEAAW